MTRQIHDRLTATQAARELGVSYATVKQWIYRGKIHSVRTPGGHHRIPASEVARLRAASRGPQPSLDSISVRNKLACVVTRLRTEGLLAEVTIDVGGQSLTAIITKSAAQDLRLRPGKEVIALIKSMGIMLIGG